MKPRLKAILTAIIIISGIATAGAQYYEIANRLPSLLSPALSGSTRYKGFVDVSYVKGFGNHNADFLSVATSQGFRYSTWFYMGVGLGCDVLFPHKDDNWGSGWDDASDTSRRYDDYTGHGSTSTGVMIPLFTDFRFNIGGMESPSFFINLRVGCSFLIGNDYIRIDNGYLTNNEYFYLKPSMGVRIPTNKNNPTQAFNIGVTYQLLTSDYWYYSKSDITLNALGVQLSYEW